MVSVVTAQVMMAGGSTGNDEYCGRMYSTKKKAEGHERHRLSDGPHPASAAKAIRNACCGLRKAALRAGSAVV
jgi:hypothetical protein